MRQVVVRLSPTVSASAVAGAVLARWRPPRRAAARRPARPTAPGARAGTFAATCWHLVLRSPSELIDRRVPAALCSVGHTTAVRIVQQGSHEVNQNHARQLEDLPPTAAQVLRRQRRCRRQAAASSPRCGGDDGGGGGGGGGGPQSAGGQLIHGATGGGSKDTLDPHQPVTAADIARVQQPLRAAALLEQQLRARAGAGRVGRVVLGRHHLDDHDARRASPSTTAQPGHRRGRLASASSASPTPKAPLSAGGQLSQIIDFESSKVVDDTTLQIVLITPVRDPRLAAGRVHPRHHPGRRVRPGQPGRHRRVRLQVVRGRQDQHLHQVRRLLGRRGLRRRAWSSRTSPTTTPRSTRCRPARSRRSTTCPTT